MLYRFDPEGAGSGRRALGFSWATITADGRETLPIGAVHSVTLVLEGSDERARLAAITRFLKDQAAYNGKRVWQGVAMVTSLKELDLCRRLKAPFLSGPMIAPLTNRPTGEVVCPALNLPIEDEPTWCEAAGYLGSRQASSPETERQTTIGKRRTRQRLGLAAMARRLRSSVQCGGLGSYSSAIRVGELPLRVEDWRRVTPKGPAHAVWVLCNNGHLRVDLRL